MGDVSDSELDDLLDNALDEFDKSKQAPVARQAHQEESAEPIRAANRDLGALEMLMDDSMPGMEEFMKQLEAGTADDVMSQMEETMRQLTSNPEFARLMEEMTRNMAASDLGGAASSQTSAKEVSGSSAGAAAPAASFQEGVASTVNQLRQSKEQSEGDVPDASADLLKLLEQSGGAGMDSMMETMMMQLMSKDVLYEPMKDLNEKYPAWLRSNEGKHSQADLARYKEQYRITSEIVAIYEGNGDSKRVLELMQQMQETGQPPAEILQQMAPGMDLGQDGFPKIPGMDDPEKCTIM